MINSKTIMLKYYQPSFRSETTFPKLWKVSDTLPTLHEV